MQFMLNIRFFIFKLFLAIINIRLALPCASYCADYHLPFVKNGNIERGRNLLWSTRSITCASGYQLVKDGYGSENFETTTKCLFSRKWSLPNVRCDPILLSSIEIRQRLGQAAWHHEFVELKRLFREQLQDREERYTIKNWLYDELESLKCYGVRSGNLIHQATRCQVTNQHYVIETVKALLEMIDGSDWHSFINARDDFNWNTPLMFAAGLGHDKVTKYLLEKLDAAKVVDETNEEGDTALHWASRAGHLDILKILLEAGAYLELRNKRGETALYQAVAFRHLSIVSFMIERRASLRTLTNNGWSVLFPAVQNCDVAMVEFLIDKGSYANRQDELGWTPLQRAIESERCEGIELNETSKLLIDNYGNVDIQNGRGETPLMIGAIHAKIQVMAFLIYRGASVNQTDYNGWSILHHALHTRKLAKKPELVAFLLQRNINTALKTSCCDAMANLTALEMAEVHARKSANEMDFEALDLLQRHAMHS